MLIHSDTQKSVPPIFKHHNVFQRMQSATDADAAALALHLVCLRLYTETSAELPTGSGLSFPPKDFTLVNTSRL